MLSKEERDRLVLDNMALAKTYTQGFLKRLNYWPLRDYDFEDLLQTARLGLIKAATKFDRSKGFAFSTLAFYCVQNELREMVRSGSLIRVPPKAFKGKYRDFAMAAAEKPLSLDWIMRRKCA